MNNFFKFGKFAKIGINKLENFGLYVKNNFKNAGTVDGYGISHSHPINHFDKKKEISNLQKNISKGNPPY